MKFLMFLATQKGYAALNTLISEGEKERIGAVVTFKEVNVTIAYHDSIEKKCSEHGISFYYWTQVKNDLQGLFKQHGISGAIAISWKYMLDYDTFNKLKYKLIVFHDSLLPKYRGFAPAPTAVICGDEFIGVTAIIACRKVDEGDIILQKSIIIDNNEYIGEIIERLSDIYSDMVLDIFRNISLLSLNTKKQDSNIATYSIWRSPEDCHIRWSDKSVNIYNLIRAVSNPYTGAFTYMDNKKIVINKAVVVPDMKFAIRDSGKVWQITDGFPTVICGEGMLKIIEAVYEDGTLVEFKRLRVRLT